MNSLEHSGTIRPTSGMGWDGTGLVDSEQLDYKSTARAVLKIVDSGVHIVNISTSMSSISVMI